MTPTSLLTVPLEKSLRAPFDPADVKWKPLHISGNRALAAAYVDARTIQDRLDQTVGLANWQDAYECLPDGAVVCTLRLRLGDEWIAKVDVGGPSEQPDEGDRRKAAFSDALKRAAVKFGVGRYLYDLPQQWCDWDPQKRTFVHPPRLPSWALPGGAAALRQPTPSTTIAAPNPLPADSRQLDRIDALVRTLGLNLDAFARRLHAKYGVHDWKSLSATQADAVIDALEKPSVRVLPEVPANGADKS